MHGPLHLTEQAYPEFQYRNPHNKLHCENDKEEGDRCPGNTLGKWPGSLSFGSSMSYSHSGRWQSCCWRVRPTEYDNVVTTKDTETIDTLSSHIIHLRMGTAYTGVGLNVMTQALCTEDGALPQGLTIQNAYTEMCNGSKNVTILVTNSMVYPQTLRKKIPVAGAVVATQVPEPLM